MFTAKKFERGLVAKIMKKLDLFLVNETKF